MNKLLVLLPISLVVLSGCKSNSKSQSATDQSPKETVQLTAGNFNKYVAIHSSSTVNSASNYYIFIRILLVLITVNSLIVELVIAINGQWARKRYLMDLVASLL